MFNELLSYLQSTKGVRFHYFKHGLYINALVEEVKPYMTDGVQVLFSGGDITLWKHNKINKIRRPDNLIIDCENCYSIKNEHGEAIGFLYN